MALCQMRTNEVLEPRRVVRYAREKIEGSLTKSVARVNHLERAPRVNLAFCFLLPCLGEEIEFIQFEREREFRLALKLLFFRTARI